jgi:hypothetical protein
MTQDFGFWTRADIDAIALIVSHTQASREK